MSSAPPPPALAARCINLTVAPNRRSAWDGDAHIVHAPFNLHKKVLFMSPALQGRPWDRVRLPPLSRQRAVCNQMRWQQQQQQCGSFIVIVNWYSCMKMLRVALGGMIVMKSEASSERAVALMMAVTPSPGKRCREHANIPMRTFSSDLGLKNDWNRRYGDGHAGCIGQLSH